MTTLKMNPLPLQEQHRNQGAVFMELGGYSIPLHYGDPEKEYEALQKEAVILDLSYRGRLCLLGSDRQRFLNGQVTNDVKSLRPGQGCYAALVTAKGKMVSDLNIYNLGEEILLDFEPGLTGTVIERLEKYIIADDVQWVDVAPHYGLLSVQGPRASLYPPACLGEGSIPEAAWHYAAKETESYGKVYVMNQPRTGSSGFDFFVPIEQLSAFAQFLEKQARELGALWCGWQALETTRLEAGIPRFGADMDESNLAPETGLESKAISYSKGCYIGQEVIARIRTYGQVTKNLRGLSLVDKQAAVPRKGDRLFQENKEVGYVTSSIFSPKLQRPIALSYVRREANVIGNRLTIQTDQQPVEAEIVALPFSKT